MPKEKQLIKGYVKIVLRDKNGKVKNSINKIGGNYGSSRKMEIV